MLPSKNKSGSALFIVLGCVALMTLLVVAFLGSSITERTTANYFAREVNTKLLAENAINIVLSQLKSATKSTDANGNVVAWASQPGMIRTYGTDGFPDNYFKLYSWNTMVGTGAYPPGGLANADVPDASWTTEPDLFTDINEAVNSRNPIIATTDGNGNPLATMTTAGHTGVLTYASVSGTADIEGFYVDPATTTPWGSSNQVPMPVMWIYILKDGTQKIPTVNGTGVSVDTTAANPIVGRIAFWTDDECSKVNINTASEGSYWDVPATWAIEDFGAYTAGNGGIPIIPTGMATAVPAGGEYQRVPGHPATTCLSTVLGSILPLPTPPYTEASYDASISRYYTLTPRYGPGGSKFGTRPSFDTGNSFSTYDSAANGGFLVPPSYRLYASSDELMFDPSRIPDTTLDGTIYLDTGSNGLSPSVGRLAIPGMTQNFLNETQFFLTANSKAPEETLFETPRISMWPISTDAAKARNVKDTLLAFCSTINHYPYYFQRGSFYQYINSATNVSGSGTVFNGAAGSVAGSSQDPAYDMGGSTAGVLITPGVADATTSYPDTSGTATLIRRNQNLMAYLHQETSQPIPGFGSGTFLLKYKVPSSSATNISEMDQILVDMFDYIRSTVNTVSLAYNPKYTFTPQTSAGGIIAGSGTALPIQMKMSAGGNVISGLGRGANTIAEISIVFMPVSFLDQTTLGVTGTSVPASPSGVVTSYPPTPGVSDGLPDDVLGYVSSGPSGTMAYDGIGDPQTTSMRAFLLIRPYSSIPSTTIQSPNYRYSISGLDGLFVDFNNGAPGNNPITGAPAGANFLLFPSAGNAVDLMSPNWAPNRCSTGIGAVGLFGPIGSGLPVNPFIRTAGFSDGTITSAGTGNMVIYPFVGGVVSLPSAANPSRFGGAVGQTDLRSGILPNTFSLRSNSNVIISISSGFQTFTNTAPVIQTITIPQASWTLDSLPIPSYARANTDSFPGQEGADGQANMIPAGHTMITSTIPPDCAASQHQRLMEFYTQVPYAIDNFTKRISCTITGTFYHYKAVIQRGDTVRSLVLNPRSTIHGDIRVLANMTNVLGTLDGDSQPVYWWMGANQAVTSTGTLLYGPGAQNSSAFTQLHSQYLDVGNSYDYLLKVNSTMNSTGTLSVLAYNYPPTIWFNDGGGVSGGGQGKTGGTLFPNAAYYNCLAPSVTPELQGAYMDKTSDIGLNGGNLTLGDWSNGIGNSQDGPMVQCPDEGFQTATGSSYSSSYYETAGGVVAGAGSTVVSESFSPNRQVASPVMFGTLPAGVQNGQGWRTLLFCPNPEAKSHHPGFGVGSGAAGPNDLPPFATKPPDHLLLDLFWMPVVDPYAISEPFATAGKINMNYQIVPFSYIHRSTGVRAVLKSIGLLALPNTASLAQGKSGVQYKSTRFHYNIVGSVDNTVNANFRYNVNLDETIDAADSGFQQRFATGDIFRSASEICNIFLVPQAIAGNTYSGAGATVPTTYTATANWWDDFQLTGDNNRESPYNQIYPRLTTKSNTFMVHFRVQTLVKNATTAANTFNTSAGDSVGGEYRGSATIERYIDPNDKTLPDFAAGVNSYTTAGTTMSPYYRFRVVRSKSFNP